MKDDVELETHHLQDTHHMEKRQCFCGPLRVPCSCAGRKKRAAEMNVSSYISDRKVLDHILLSVSIVRYGLPIINILDFIGIFRYSSTDALADHGEYLASVLDVKSALPTQKIW